MMRATYNSRLSPDPIEISDDELYEVSNLLNMWQNFSMSSYKDKCMKRRIAIRMRATGCNDVAAYCNLLRQSSKEPNLLHNALTVHVSHFFRDPEMFEKLKTEVLPRLPNIMDKYGHYPAAVWSLGCAGGEEPYSMAILIKEYFGDNAHKDFMPILGTDIDEKSIKSAQAGLFHADRLKEVSPERKKRFFLHETGGFRMIPEILDMVTFIKQDITSVEPYIKSYMVLCRNMLIYFTRLDQEKILNRIADILPQDGILVLGKSESLVGESKKRFVAVCPKVRIYRKI